MLFLILLIVYILFSIFINTCPIVYQWDESFIILLQNCLSSFSNEIPILLDDKLFNFFLFLPQILFSIIFFFKRKFLDIAFVWGVSYSSYLFNIIQKDIVQRPRPNLDLHIIPHPDSFSFVSNHTLITFTLYAVVTYYVFQLTDNRIIRNFILFFSILWALVMGFSRIWLGVHNPTDVIAAYLLGSVFFVGFIHLRSFIKKYIGL